MSERHLATIEWVITLGEPKVPASVVLCDLFEAAFDLGAVAGPLAGLDCSDRFENVTFERGEIGPTGPPSAMIEVAERLLEGWTNSCNEFWRR